MNVNQSLRNFFYPLVAQWFQEQIGQPTDLQQQAWPKIAAGEHILITGPTGSGKTFAAFLWAINQLITGRWPVGHTSVLYISPLRALNYDIQRNLLDPLKQLKQIFIQAGESFPEIQVLTRSGDTSASDRRRMLRRPPEILITTPESLNLLLSSKGGRATLTHLATVILDEIHAVFGTKRGVYLITAVDRLVQLSGEFQRVALSATIRPLDVVAEFVGGFTTLPGGKDKVNRRRPVSLIQSRIQKKYDLRVQSPQEEERLEPYSSSWEPIVREVKEVIARNRSTLVFVNSRRLCEFLTLQINAGETESIAYAHHGSLALEIRREVERRLKEGKLRAIVATHSLELGIDIGALDEVILIQTPFTISSAIQRIGRAGHQVGETSRGTLFPSHPKDLLESAVLAPSILAQDIEATRPVSGPLDVLAQIIVSMVGVETWKIEDLFDQIRPSYPYRNLNREQFDLVLNMLAGRYADTRIRELNPLISIDRMDQTVAARRGALQILYSSGGVIPDRGYFHLRHQETNARIGELDEEFVWEASVGDTFALGTQNWQIQRIAHNDVWVLPGKLQANAAPFWKGEENNRDFHFSQKIGLFLEEADRHLFEPDFAASLMQSSRMDEASIQKLIDFLKQQKDTTGCSLPHRHHLVMEFVSAGPGGTSGKQIVIHTLWGGRVNRPLALALEGAWEEKFHQRLELFVSNDCIVLQNPNEVRGEEILEMLSAERIEILLRSVLEQSGFFGARFRECAGRALLIPHHTFTERQPLWLSRLRSQKLLDAVLSYEDFPILLETWRTCLQDEFDLENLKKLSHELKSGEITWSEVHTGHPSPFAQGDWWRQVNQYMYMDDTPLSGKTSRLREDLISGLVLTPGLRPSISREVAVRFELRRQRLAPGYSPQTSRELLDWVVERLLIPKNEWEEILKAIRKDHGLDSDSLLESLHNKLVYLLPANAEDPLITARESLPRTLHLYGRRKDLQVKTLDRQPIQLDETTIPAEEEREDLGSWLAEWLRFYGPRPISFIQKTLGVEEESLQLTLEDLIDSQTLLRGQLIKGGRSDEICERENFEILLRMARAEAQPQFRPLGIEWLPLFLAYYQRITNAKQGREGLSECLEPLFGYPAEAEIWESEIFPARLKSYDPSWLDTLMQEGELFWVGNEGQRITFCYSQDLDLLREESSPPIESPAESSVQSENPMNKKDEWAALFPDPNGRYDFSALLRNFQGSRKDLFDQLWNEVWRGRLTNDSFISLRRGILNQFQFPSGTPKEGLSLRHRRRRRFGLAKRKDAPYLVGNWFLLPKSEAPDDLLEMEERKKDRVRLLLDRYGILFRELLQRELPVYRWASIFRSLRIMELSGEVLSGYFFHGIPGLQFISPQAFRILQGKLPEDAVYWLNAADPASMCGVLLDAIHEKLPARHSTTHLVYRGNKLMVISKRNGQEFTFFFPPDDPRFAEYTDFLRHMLTRHFQPIRRIRVETINGEKAVQSPYLPGLRTSFEVLTDYRFVNLLRKIMGR
jgi:ATP-dependent helicase Lhr and Lhr-like helicase